MKPFKMYVEFKNCKGFVYWKSYKDMNSIYDALRDLCKNPNIKKFKILMREDGKDKRS